MHSSLHRAIAYIALTLRHRGRHSLVAVCGLGFMVELHITVRFPVSQLSSLNPQLNKAALRRAAAIFTLSIIKNKYKTRKTGQVKKLTNTCYKACCSILLLQAQPHKSLTLHKIGCGLAKRYKAANCFLAFALALRYLCIKLWLGGDAVS